MKKEVFYSLISAVILILGASAFSWYELRPRNIKIDCSKTMLIRSKELVRNSNLSLKEKQDVYEFLYKKCLRDNGL